MRCMEPTPTKERRLVELALRGVIITPVFPENMTGSWTRFQDTDPSLQKEPWKEIFIQAPREAAGRVFHHLFRHTACGKEPEYAAFELEDAALYIPQLTSRSTLFIKATDILPAWTE
jgi:hypothetical protein